jgi:YVTN family beta-propeller protein
LSAYSFKINWVRLIFLGFVTLVFGVFCQAPAYLLQSDHNTRGRIVSPHWSDSRARSGVEFTLNADSFPFPESDVVRIVQNSFRVWNAVPSSFLDMSYQGTSTLPASDSDRRNVVIYDATGRSIGAPAGSGIIAITRVNWNDNGEITDADIIFNGRDFIFSTSDTDTPNRQVDLQDVLTHEVGHFFGLNHTPLVGAPEERPTMNPFNTSELPRSGRSLEDDDRAGIAALYLTGTLTGGISGRVLRTDGAGSYGVHVVAYTANTRTFVASTLSGSAGASLGQGGEGGFEILGLPPGDYHVAIEPHHSSISPDNFGGIFGNPFDDVPEIEFYSNASIQTAAEVIRVVGDQTITNVDFAIGLAVPGSPFIQNPNLPANTPDPNGPYRFSARVTDNVAVVGVDLQYRINSGNSQVVSMRLSAGDVYSAEISGQRPGSVIEYRIVAGDGDGNSTSFPALDSPMARFEVLALSGSPVAYVAVRDAQVVSVIDTGPGTEVARIATGETPLSVLMTPDERYLFVANTGSQGASDNRITVIETSTHQVAKTIVVGTSPLDLAVSPDGRLVYVSNSQGRSVSVIDVASLEETLRLNVSTVGDGPFGIAVSLDGARLYVSDIDASTVRVLNANTGATQAQVSVVASPRSLVLSPDGTRLYVAGFDGDIGVVNTTTNTMDQVIDTGAGSIFRVAVSPDGGRVYATDRANGNLLVVNTAEGRVTNTLPVLADASETRDLFVSPDGERVYVTNQNSDDLVVFDTATLRVLRAFQVVNGPRGIAVRSRPFNFEPSADVAGKADFDASGAVGFGDFLLFAGIFGLSNTDSGFDARFDLDDDNRVNFGDFLLFAGVFGRSVDP